MCCTREITESAIEVQLQSQRVSRYNTPCLTIVDEKQKFEQKTLTDAITHNILISEYIVDEKEKFMEKQLLRDDLIERLKQLDEEASLMFDQAERLHLIIVGGGALVLMEIIPRSTHDIDVLDASKQLMELIQHYDINTKVQTYINNFPYNYEDRIQRLDIDGKIIDFFTASLEDIVIAKLYSIRDTDWEDITSSYVLDRLDWEILHSLAINEDEAKASAINETRYREFLDSFTEYERRFRPCDN